jgi:hypothetical protein
VRTRAVGPTVYRLVAVEGRGRWVAHAERSDTGARFGIECAGRTEDEAADRLERWLCWQHEHRAALEALQQAEQAYHRTIAGSAFASPAAGAGAIEMRKAALGAVEVARARLDDVRARNPEGSEVEPWRC